MKKVFKVASDPLQTVFEDSGETPISPGRAVDPRTCSCGEGLLNSRQAAQYLGVSERTLWTVKTTGGLPSIKIGGCVRYQLADLVEYINAQRSHGDGVYKGAA